VLRGKVSFEEAFEIPTLSNSRRDQAALYIIAATSMRASLLQLLEFVLPVLSLPHYYRDGHVSKNVTTVVIGLMPTSCPAPTPPSPPYPNEGHGNGEGDYGNGGNGDGFNASITRTPSTIFPTPTLSSTRSSTPTPTSSDLALKRDWNLDAANFTELEPKKSCRMLYSKPELLSGSRMLLRSLILQGQNHFSLKTDCIPCQASNNQLWFVFV